MKKILSLSMAMLMIASCAVGCGKKDDSEKDSKSDYIGKWEPEKLAYDDEEVTDFFGLPVAVLGQYDLQEDGTCLFYSPLDEGDGASKGKWTADGTTVTITLPDDHNEDEDDDEVFEYKNGKLVLEEEEEDGSTTKVYLVKVDEFTTVDPGMFDE